MAIDREAAARLDAAAKSAQERVRATILVLRAVRVEDVVPSGDTDLVTLWWGTYFATLATLDDTMDGLRTIRQEARRRVQRTVRLYTIRPGDTLESIARMVLGNAARGGELGLRPEQLSPGRVIRIPEPA